MEFLRKATVEQCVEHANANDGVVPGRTHDENNLKLQIFHSWTKIKNRYISSSSEAVYDGLTKDVKISRVLVKF